MPKTSNRFSTEIGAENDAGLGAAPGVKREEVDTVVRNQPKKTNLRATSTSSKREEFEAVKEWAHAGARGKRGVKGDAYRRAGSMGVSPTAYDGRATRRRGRV